MIEILIAIGVILILFGIGIYGYRAVIGTGEKKQTIGILATASGLLKEMNSTGSYSRIEGVDNSPTQPQPYYDLGLSLTNPGDVNEGKAGRDKIVKDNPAKNTPSQPRLMRILKTNPKIASMIAAVPSTSLVTNTGVNEPVLADAWGNPILLVPSGGLKDVKFESDNYATPQLITSSGQAISPANRAFWASAGPDGDFSKGDDNIYSFQN